MELLNKETIAAEYRRVKNARNTKEAADMFFAEPGSPDWHFLRGAQQALGWALGDLSTAPSKLVRPAPPKDPPAP